ncbi:MAG: YdgA family protein [Comamonas sp.]|nr:YdgA family protein [Comamonas sp.]
MNKKVGIGIAAAAAIVVAGALGTSYYMGGKLQQGFTEGAAKWSQDGLKVQITSYERGAFSSTAKTVWTLERGDEPLQFTAEHQISHGPLPLGHAAEIHTRFNLPDDTDAAVKTALNGRSPLEVETKLGWNRSSSNVMTSPAISAKVSDSDMQWGGMKIDWNMPADMKAAKGTANFAALQFKDEEGSFSMDKANMRFDVKQPEGQQFWTGPFALTIAKLETRKQEEDKASTSSFEGISMDSDTVLKGDVVEMIFKSGIKSAKLDDKKADDLALDMAFRNVDAGWINQVMEMAKRQSPLNAAKDGDDAEDGDDGAAGHDLRGQLTKTVAQALARKPAIEITRLSMRTPEGVSEFGAAVEYLGDGQNMSRLLKDVKLSLKAQLPQPVLDSFMLSRKRRSLIATLDDENDYPAEEIEAAAKAQAQSSLDNLKAQGVFEDKGGMLSTLIVYANGEFQVNGKPLDQLGSATLMGEALE